MPSRTRGLLKFGNGAHIDDLVRGHLYINPLSYFSELEDGDRGDPFEGVGHLLQPEGVLLSMQVGSEYQPVRLGGALQLRPHGGLQANLFCM